MERHATRLRAIAPHIADRQARGRPMFRRIILTMSAFYSQATATPMRRVVFSVLLVWALALVVSTARTMPTATLGVLGGVMSLSGSLLFIGLVALVWDWLAHRWGS